ncbi:MAG TPA: nucleotidyltransferase family protein [Xanthomonadaceae bacterium]|nr:nucleotidyltransferase family protein [Xanthomonadaceae bacterium]
MRALILAAGRGERMRPLTDVTPKPLLQVGGKPLIVHHIEKLAAIGVHEIVINTAHLTARFPERLGDGERWGVHLHYSAEGEIPLETGGGMLHAMRLLGGDPFLLVNGDVWTDYDFARLPREPEGVAHLVLVAVPPEKPRGDFALGADGRVRTHGAPLLTYAGIGSYRPQVLEGWRKVVGAAQGASEDPPRFALAPILRGWMAHEAISGEHHHGGWCDVGTPERLAMLDARLRA